MVERGAHHQERTMAKEREPRSKLGPIPPEAFENDAISNPEPDKRPGSVYAWLKDMLDERDKKKPKK